MPCPCFFPSAVPSFFNLYLLGYLGPWQRIWLSLHPVPGLQGWSIPWYPALGPTHHPKAFSSRQMAIEVLPILPVGRNLAIGLGVGAEQTTAQGLQFGISQESPSRWLLPCSSVTWPRPVCCPAPPGLTVAFRALHSPLHTPRSPASSTSVPCFPC